MPITFEEGFSIVATSVTNGVSVDMLSTLQAELTVTYE